MSFDENNGFTKVDEQTTIKAEVVEEVKEENAPATIEENTPALTNNTGVVDIDKALSEWEAYQIFTKKLLNETDYVNIKGKAFKKKSAWRKYARAFNINTEIIEKDITRNDKGVVTEAEFIVRATLPDGRHCDGWGNCSKREGNKNKPNHDIPATAMTRATNRAIADLIGAGEVTAEEVIRG